MLMLRNELARLHGYRNYADYALVDRMAGTPEAVAQLLAQVWEPAKRVRRQMRRPAGDGTGPRRNAPDRTLGLALLRGESAQGTLRI
jgi:hypothetical protein